MRVPTDSEINTQVCRALGWDGAGEGDYRVWYYPYDPKVPEIVTATKTPDFCKDYTALTELLKVVPPRVVVIAALKALGRWPEGWSVE